MEVHSPPPSHAYDLGSNPLQPNENTFPFQWSRFLEAHFLILRFQDFVRLSFCKQDRQTGKQRAACRWVTGRETFTSATLSTTNLTLTGWRLTARAKHDPHFLLQQQNIPSPVLRPIGNNTSHINTPHGYNVKCKVQSLCTPWRHMKEWMYGSTYS